MADYSHLGAVPVKSKKDYSHLGAVPAKTYKGRFLDEEPEKTVVPDVVPTYEPRDFAVGGLTSLGAGRGMNAVKRGAKIEDIPGVIAKAAGGYYGDLPERSADRPILTSLAGPFGPATRGTSPESKKLPFPRPVTSEGKVLGKELESLSSVAQLGNLASDIPKILNSSVDSLKRFSNLRKQTGKAQDLSQELLAQMEEARKTAGAMQGGYIDANAEEAVNADKLKQIIARLPQSLREEILSNPGIQRTTNSRAETSIDAAGLPILNSFKSDPEISANLKNAETLRGIIKGKVPSSRWNPKLVLEPEKNAADLAYTELGNLMTEGRPELAEAMYRYSKARGAEKQLEPLIRTRQGFTRTKPILKMFSGNEGVPSQAIEILAEHNPEILGTVDKIRKYGHGIASAEALKKAAKIAAFGLASGGGASAGWGAIKRSFGG